MGKAGIFGGLVNRQVPTREQAEQQNRRKYLFGLLLVVLICLLATIFGVMGLWRAWQNGRWDDSYWVDNFTIQVCAPLISVLSSSVGLTLYFSQRATGKAKDQQNKPANRKISTTVIAFSPLLLIVLFAATLLACKPINRTDTMPCWLKSAHTSRSLMIPCMPQMLTGLPVYPAPILLAASATRTAPISLPVITSWTRWHRASMGMLS
jgi:heme/copper-type cytochrome/quinol oxidase subunit 2